MKYLYLVLANLFLGYFAFPTNCNSGCYFTTIYLLNNFFSWLLILLQLLFLIFYFNSNKTKCWLMGLSIFIGIVVNYLPQLNFMHSLWDTTNEAPLNLSWNFKLLISGLSWLVIVIPFNIILWPSKNKR